MRTGKLKDIIHKKRCETHAAFFIYILKNYAEDFEPFFAG
jgi:hypothetical protein